MCRPATFEHSPRASDKLDERRSCDKIKLCTSLAKTVFLLGSVVSLVGGVAYSLVMVKASAGLKVNVVAKTAMDVSLDTKAKASSKPKTAAKSKALTTGRAKVGPVKGKKTMNTINIGKNNVWFKASSLLGE